MHAKTNYIDTCVNSHHIHIHVRNINYIVLFENSGNVWNNMTKEKTGFHCTGKFPVKQ